ncbi:Peptidoglycan binding-like [uncultured Caudovirales phage]|uniref:Peptidoglycan binding-like n=1 Tax=uncultured Caudovirales phage TaxID=2100421 RepID=A0A6J5MQ75_9CAUD|nr:Peptidoglycan binding-like [uncultured Caudovirales phage]
MAEKLHPALVGKNIELGTPEAFIAVADFYAKQKYSEKPKNSNHTIFGAWYGVQTAWCAMFVSYCLNHSGNGKTINGAQSKKGYALCSKGIRWFKKKAAWLPVKKAQPGDVAFFDWNHDHDPDHTGIIVKVDLKRKRVLTIEGNTGPKNLSNGGAVMKQWRSMSVIIGVGRPAWPALAAPAAPATPAVTKVETPAPVATPTPVTVVEPAKTVLAAKPALPGILSVGSKGAAVKFLQEKLNIEADGIFGNATKAAVIVFQVKHGLTADGVVGNNTWGKL